MKVFETIEADLVQAFAHNEKPILVGSREQPRDAPAPTLGVRSIVGSFHAHGTDNGDEVGGSCSSLATG